MTAEMEAEDIAILERIRAICLTFPGAEEAELQSRPLFRVGKRRFALFNAASAPPRPRWNSSGRSLHFLSDRLEAEALTVDPRFRLSPHHGDHGWLALRLEDDSIDWQEIAELLETAYRLVTPRTLRAP